MKTSDLLEQRAAIVDRMNAAHTADDGAAFDTAETELRALDGKIERAKKIEQAERTEAGTVLSGDPKLSGELHKRFSLVRAMAMQAGIGGHDFGFEREVQPELLKRAGKPTAEGVLCPLEIFLERRASLSTTNPSGATGANLIATELHGEYYFDRLRAALKVQSLGATVLSGLVGNIDIPGLKDSVSTGWVAEDTALNGSVPGFRKVSMTPKHAGGITEISRNMLQQSSVDVENLIRSDFAYMLAALVDAAAINGSGSGSEPRGILNTSGIGSVAMGTNGAALTADATRDLIGKVDIADAPNTSRAFLTNNKVKVATSKIKDGQGNYMGFGPEGVFAGERTEFSSQVPSDLTKGTGTSLSALIYGNWADLLIGYWSAFDLLVNPYESTAYAKGNVSVRAMLTCDIAVRYAESFAAIKDVVA
ncbi:phage major capsid protein [Novosphingobium humi]|uniref:Phage major capsid protein n=1 Tax=Novosphingobium humi TaxID=2282397 RepID=A0ABY7TWW6_9SPHN|nr:phage major capsid protein [Novosphingobium humi]WCT77511.1 phage major capsid protein [Novosphingobium humi]